MANIDVSSLLLDPDFINPLVLIHRTSTVDDYGKLSLVETQVNTYGSVQPTTGKQLSRLPEALQTSDVRTFYIKAEILCDGSSQYPDIILFGGYRYEVKAQSPWLNWGAGWNEAICVRQDVAA